MAALILGILLATMVVHPAADAVPLPSGDQTLRVSVDTTGGDPNLDSYRPSVSADGRFVAFSSEASDLVAGDTNDFMDVFVRDRLKGTTTRVSVDSDEHQIAGVSDAPSISGDGRYVAFESVTFGAVAAYTNVWVRDLKGGTTVRVSVGIGGAATDGDSASPSISADGRYVAFESAAANLVDGDTNNHVDVFVRDMVANTTWRVMGPIAAGAPVPVQGNYDSRTPAISANGQYVAFRSQATNLVPGGTPGGGHVYRCAVGGLPELISVNSESELANEDSFSPAICGSGRYVAFQSEASNLADGDLNGFSDVFVRDTQTSTTTRVSVNTSGGDADSGSSNPSISSDGRYVAFESEAGNLDDSGLTPGTTNEIYRRDTVTHVTQRMSVPLSGENELQSAEPCISADGMHVAFRSGATNLVPNDGNNVEDVFVRTLGTTTKVHRFYNRKNGSHFYTPDEVEKASVIANLSHIYTYEGVAYTFNGSLSFQPLYRFYNKRNGSHFYTASEVERDNVIATLSGTYQYDGPTYKVAVLPGTGVTVWRFFNKKNGSHFYTASEAEKASVIANLSAVYRLEGGAFYLPQ